MKRIGLFLSLAFIIFFVMFSTSNARADSNSENNITTVGIYKYKLNIKKVTPISGKTFVNKLNKKQSFIVFFGFKECPYCRKFSPVLKKYLSKKNHKRVYYVNLDQFNPNKKKDVKIVRTIQKKTKLKETPTIQKITHGRVSKTLIGSGMTLKQLDNL